MLKDTIYLRVKKFLSYISKQNLLNKAIIQVSHETLSSFILKIIRIIFLNDQKNNLIFGQYLKFYNQNFMLQRHHLYVPFCFGLNWIHKNNMGILLYKDQIIKYSSHLLQSLTTVSGKKIRLVKQKKSRRLKLKKTCKCMTPKLVGLIKQSLSPKLFISRKAVLRKMVQWGMLNCVLYKPIACWSVLKYPDVQLIEYFKSKAKSLLVYYQPASNYS